MRWPQETAVSRRDDQLARTRRLTIRIAGGATVASIGLAGALGFALPGKTSGTASQSAHGATGTASGTPQRGGTSPAGHAARQHHHHARHLAPPAHHPATTPQPPVVSSGGS